MLINFVDNPRNSKDNQSFIKSDLPSLMHEQCEVSIAKAELIIASSMYSNCSALPPIKNDACCFLYLAPQIVDIFNKKKYTIHSIVLSFSIDFRKKIPEVKPYVCKYKNLNSFSFGDTFQWKQCGRNWITIWKNKDLDLPSSFQLIKAMANFAIIGNVLKLLNKMYIHSHAEAEWILVTQSKISN